ncbi:hypothetical protein DL98DRAFT_443491, partial [Cadophora sp. DSE1049]
RLDLTIILNRTTNKNHVVRFRKGKVIFKKTVNIRTLLKQIRFYIILANILFFFYL